MRTIYGICPHCAQPVQCGILENKVAVVCPGCHQPLFAAIRAKLKAVNILFILPILVSMIGVALRPTLGLWGCIGLIALGISLLFVVLFLERHLCQRLLSTKR